MCVCVWLPTGKQIVGYVVKPDGRWEVIGTRSPQDAQVSRKYFSSAYIHT